MRKTHSKKPKKQWKIIATKEKCQNIFFRFGRFFSENFPEAVVCKDIINVFRGIYSIVIFNLIEFDVIVIVWKCTVCRKLKQTQSNNQSG